MLLRQLSYAIKNQRKTRNASSMGLWVSSAVSSWQKRAGVRIIWSTPTQITLIKVLYDDINQPDAGEEEEHGHVPYVHADDETDPGHYQALVAL